MSSREPPVSGLHSVILFGEPHQPSITLGHPVGIYHPSHDSLGSDLFTFSSSICSKHGSHRRYPQRPSRGSSDHGWSQIAMSRGFFSWPLDSILMAAAQVRQIYDSRTISSCTLWILYSWHGQPCGAPYSASSPHHSPSRSLGSSLTSRFCSSASHLPIRFCNASTLLYHLPPHGVMPPHLRFSVSTSLKRRVVLQKFGSSMLVLFRVHNKFGPLVCGAGVIRSRACS